MMIPGPRGPAGAAGSTGATGATGAAGSNGPSGDAGLNAYCSIPLTSTQPAVGATIDVRPSPSTACEWAIVGQIVFLYAGGYYEVMAPNVAGRITIKNLGYTGNAAPGASVGGGYLGPAGLVGTTGATGATGATGPAANAFSPAAFAAGISSASITETNDATARTYGYKVVPVRSGMLSTGMLWLAKTASDQSFKLCLWDSTSLLESITVAHTAGTSSHTTTWTTGGGAGGAHILTCGKSYWFTLYCTTSGKSRNYITYTGDTLQGPDVYLGQFFMTDGIWLRQSRYDVGDVRPTSDIGTGVIYPITGLFSG